MPEPSSSTASRIVALSEALAALEARIAVLEARIEGPTLQTERAIEETSSLDHTAVRAEIAAAPWARPKLPSLGRAMLMLAGAFLLRALTDAGVVSGQVGVALGLFYAVFVIFLTDRAARVGRRSSASLYGVAAVLVTYPFVWETATKLELLSPAAAAIVTVLVTTLGLGVTVHRRLRGVAWVFIGAALATTTGLAWTSAAPTLFAALVVALGVASVWLGYIRGWTGPRWPTAAFANSLVLLLVLLAIRSGEPLPGRPDPVSEAVLALALALPAFYLGSFFAYTLSGHREAGLFEVLQSLGCLVAGFLGAVLLQQSRSGSVVALGWTAVLFAAANYALAFAFVRRHQGSRQNFFYFAWLGFLLAIAGTVLVLPDRWLPYVWGTLGIVAAIAGGHFDRWTLRLHCAAYLIGAAAVTGFPGAVVDAFIAPASETWRRLRAPGLAAWLIAILGYVMLVVTQRWRALSAWRRIPRFLLAGLVLAGAGSLLVSVIVAWLRPTVPVPAEALVATVRTVVLAVTIVLLAGLGRSAELVELSWFVNPLLVATGLKLLVEDLRLGMPISLFLSFTCFGIALIVAPRLRRRGGSISGSSQAHTTETEPRL